MDGAQSMVESPQAESCWLGIASSPACVRVAGENGCAERCIRTLQQNRRPVRAFATVAERRLGLPRCRGSDNEHRLIERHGHRSPAPLRSDQLGVQPIVG